MYAMHSSAPHQALTLAPYLLGYQPDNALVVIGDEPGHRRFAFRFDLPVSDPEDLVWELYGRLILNRASWMIPIGYGTAELTQPLLRTVQEALESVLTVTDVLRVDEGRWWSLTCKDSAACCPAEGTTLGSGPKAAAVAAAESRRVFNSRPEQPAEMVTAVVGEDLMWMIAETERAEAELLTPGWRRPRRYRQRSALALDLTGRSRRLTDHEAARLSVALAYLRDRGEALALLAETGTDQRMQVWADLTRRAVGRYAAGPAVLWAVSALLAGDLRTATTAMDRCQDADYRDAFIPVWGTFLPTVRKLLAERVNPEDVRLAIFEDHGGRDGGEL